MTLTLPRRDAQVLDAKGMFSHQWYETLRDASRSVNGIVNGQTIYSDSGVANAMEINSGISVYSAGLTRFLVPAFLNTSSAITLSDSGLPAQVVKFPNGTFPAAGQIAAGVTLEVIYSGAAWEIQSLQPSNQAVTGNLTVAGYVLTTPVTVANLPTGAAGAKAFVTDATVTTFASIVAGTGANGVPVYHDGTNWRIG